MAAGFEIYNEEGRKIQIREDAITYSMTKRGVLHDNMFETVVSSFGNVSYYEMPLNGAVAPVVAFRSNSDTTRVCGRTMWSNAHKSMVIVFNKWYNLSAEGVEYFVFDAVPQRPGNYGLQMFSENNELTFDATWPLLDILQVINIPPRSHDVESIASKGLTFEVPYPAGSFAVCIAAPRAASVGQDIGQNSLLMDCAWIVNNKIRVALVTTRTPGAIPATQWASDNGLSILVVNTKNL